ncbi:MAG: hypothetical protein LBB54_01255, partial [Cellulomonadaceae bacterium]|nr:hypothetical protein [Cellulomonadaceae bacterium]
MTDMDFTPQTPADTTATPVVDTNIVNDDTTADDTTADNATPTAALWGRLAQLQWLLHRQQSGRRRRRGPPADASRG